MAELRRRGARALLALCFVVSAAAQFTPTAIADSSINTQYFARMNQERADNGKQALAWRSDLADVAQAWAQHMASAQVLAHNPGLTRQVHDWRLVGENVGEGPTLDDLDGAFMSSPEHRDNILCSQYTEVGVGSAQTNGRIWIVVDFREPVAQATAAVAHFVRPTAAAPVGRKPATARPDLAAFLMRRLDLPFAPGCMLRFGWF